MTTKDPKKRRASQERYRAKKHRERYGPNAGDMRGRHGNHARGPNNARWNKKKLITSHGYVLVRVEPTHPRAFGPPRLRNFKYAYEHDVVMERALGRHLRRGETVHHLNGRRDDNRPENLAVKTRTEHAKLHDAERGRDRKGRFPPADLRVREWPEVRP